MATLATTYLSRTHSPAAQVRQRRHAPHLWLLGFCGLFAVGLRVGDLDRIGVFQDEARYAVVARGLGTEGSHPIQLNPDYALPTPSEPATFVKLVAAAQSRFGSTDTAARLPSLVSGALAIPAIYALGQALYGRPVGLLAAILLAGSPLAVATSRLAIPQAAQSVALLGLAFCCVRLVRDRNPLAAAAAIGCLIAAASLGALASTASPEPWHFYFSEPYTLAFYLTLPVLGLAFVGGASAVIRRSREDYFLLSWALGSTAFLVISPGKAWYLLLLLLPPILLLAARALWTVLTWASARGFALPRGYELPSLVMAPLGVFLVVASVAYPAVRSLDQSRYGDFGLGIREAAQWLDRTAAPERGILISVMTRYPLRFYSERPLYDAYSDLDWLETRVQNGSVGYVLMEPYSQDPTSEALMRQMVREHQGRIVYPVAHAAAEPGWPTDLASTVVIFELTPVERENQAVPAEAEEPSDDLS